MNIVGNPPSVASVESLRLRVSPTCAVREMAGRGLILDLMAPAHRERMVELDERELFTISNLDGQRTVRDVSLLYAKAFGVEKQVALGRIADMCIRLYQRRMLRTSSAEECASNAKASVMSSLSYTRNPEAVLCAEDECGGTIFLPNPCGFRTMNQTGLLVWEMCDGTNSVTDIVDRVMNEYDGVSESDARRDVQDFVEDLLSGCFVWVSGALAEDVDQKPERP